MTIFNFAELLEKVIHSLPDHIVVLDSKGRIVFTNQAWNRFGSENHYPQDTGWEGVNYLEVCVRAAQAGDEFGKQAAMGINAVTRGEERFQLEYPCHSPSQKRWFLMNVIGVEHDGSRYVAISHINITLRKLAEEHAHNLSRTDGLTGLFNRRHFDNFLSEEWKRAARLGLPLTVAMIDIDHFKLLNDTYGHQYGDQCLIKVAEVLKHYARRPGDICARYGGEEFVLVFGNSTLEMVLPELHNLLDEVRALQLPNANAPTAKTVTVSIGAAAWRPLPGTNASAAIEAADAALYRAKNGGRNRIEL
ncbi:sensor domain-containing diguanylate cyclase [Geobacter benzoatilyticus]|uniref:diguanylate cyclase n=1 Tax=Geobacter benzoatilyticus TaxID=2815309 RepID=A0ABX7Q3C7_9BACT|nr:sensor domain-containing diguanylate cyclase [Geobacter benzoatilyticus]QSV45952.1 GGDEF domain-containing protein [Geobacter benzoatilyticus]